MTTRHVKVGAGADTGDARAEHPHWNRAHLAPAYLLLCIAEAVPIVWTNMPAADTPIYGVPSPMIMTDLRYVSQLRLMTNVEVAGAAGSQMLLKWYDSLGTEDWLEASPDGTLSLLSISSVGFKDSGWFDIDPDIPAENSEYTKLQVWGRNGNGVADPSFGLTAVYAR
jgi:hypothetical protein